MAVINNGMNANSVTPLLPLQGGLGVSNPTANGVLVAQGASAVTPIVLGAGQVLIGTTSSAPVAATLTAGTGVSITSASGAITINASANGTWVDQTTASVTMVANRGYTADAGASQITFTLPVSATIGDFVEIQGKGAGLYIIAQAVGQQVFFGNVSSTSGVTGSVSSSLQYDAIKLRALSSTTWSVVSSVGNFSVA